MDILDFVNAAKNDPLNFDELKIQELVDMVNELEECLIDEGYDVVTELFTDMSGSVLKMKHGNKEKLLFSFDKLVY